MIKNILFAAAVAASIGCVAPPAVATVFGSVWVAPPVAQDEVAPSPRPGYVRAPGYWDWRRNRHVWVAGSWEPECRGYSYNAAQWQQHDGRWSLRREEWVRGEPVIAPQPRPFPPVPRLYSPPLMEATGSPHS